MCYAKNALRVLARWPGFGEFDLGLKSGGIGQTVVGAFAVEPELTYPTLRKFVEDKSWKLAAWARGEETHNKPEHLLIEARKQVKRSLTKKGIKPLPNHIFDYDENKKVWFSCIPLKRASSEDDH